MNRPFGYRETVPGREVNWLSSLEATSVISPAEIGVEESTAWRRGSSGQDCVYLREVTHAHRYVPRFSDPCHRMSALRQVRARTRRVIECSFFDM